MEPCMKTRTEIFQNKYINCKFRRICKWETEMKKVT